MRRVRTALDRTVDRRIFDIQTFVRIFVPLRKVFFNFRRKYAYYIIFTFFIVTAAAAPDTADVLNVKVKAFLF